MVTRELGGNVVSTSGRFFRYYENHKCRIKRLSVIFNFDVTAMQTEVYRDKIGHGNHTYGSQQLEMVLVRYTGFIVLPDEVGGSIPPQAAITN